MKSRIHALLAAVFYAIGALAVLREKIAGAYPAAFAVMVAGTPLAVSDTLNLRSIFKRVPSASKRGNAANFYVL